MTPTRVLLLSTCLTLLGLTASCAATDEPPRNLVIIVVDTLRADALGLYGSEFETSPHIDAFGRESVVFDRAWAQGTYTLSSYMSYMTSTHVRTHGLDYPPPILYPPGGVCGWTDLETLPELLAGHGFRCDAYVANATLHPRSGFPRGFDTWNDLRVEELPDLDLRGLAYHIDDPTVVARARLALSTWAPRARHFLYLHLFGPHLPIEPSDEARDRFELAVDFAPYGRLTVWQANRWRQEPNAEQREILRTIYLKHLTIHGSSQGTRSAFKRLHGYIENGLVRPLLWQTYPLSKIRQAQADFKQKLFVGKLVIQPDTKWQPVEPWLR